MARQIQLAAGGMGVNGGVFSIVRRWLARPAGVALLAAVLLATSSCATERLEISHSSRLMDERIALLVKGSTTKSHAVELLGEPLDKVLTPEGEKYFYKDFNLNAVHLEFDKNGVLQDYTAEK